MTKDDVRIFFRITGEKDDDGKPVLSQQGIRRMQVTCWAPGMKTKDTTVVSMLNGEKLLLDHKFSEFHAWIIGPAVERDQRLKDAGLVSRPGRPKKKVDPIPETAETEQTENTNG